MDFLLHVRCVVYHRGGAVVSTAVVGDESSRRGSDGGFNDVGLADSDPYQSGLGE